MRSPSVTSAGGQDVPCGVNRPSEPSGCGSGGGWIAPWLDPTDRHFDDQGFNDFRPQDATDRIVPAQRRISFEPIEGDLSVLADYIGAHNITGATDYPHFDGFFPGPPGMIRERLEPNDPRTARAVVFRGEASGVGRRARWTSSSRPVFPTARVLLAS
jgi:hypothetical protein